jgi:hypothetical protein
VKRAATSPHASAPFGDDDELDDDRIRKTTPAHDIIATHHEVSEGGGYHFPRVALKKG